MRLSRVSLPVPAAAVEFGLSESRSSPSHGPLRVTVLSESRSAANTAATEALRSGSQRLGFGVERRRRRATVYCRCRRASVSHDTELVTKDAGRNSEGLGRPDRVSRVVVPVTRSDSLRLSPAVVTRSKGRKPS